MSSINIVKPSDNFEFDKMVLGAPSSLTSQTFFSKLTNDNQEFFLLTPPCKLKNGFISSSKTTYCDLMFKNSDNIVSFMENFENVIQKMIYARRDKWFHDTIEMDDIENIFTSPLKSYKSGKYFTLRVFTNSPRNIVENNIKVYDQYDNDIGLSNIQNDDTIVCVLHVNGLKFSSKIFQVYFELKQVVVLNETNDPFSQKIIVSKKDTEEDLKLNNEDDKKETIEELQQTIEEPQQTIEKIEQNQLSQTESLSNSNSETINEEENINTDENIGNNDISNNDTNDLISETNNTNNENGISEVSISMPKTDDTIILNNEVSNDIKDQRKELYYKAKSKAIEARLNALKMIAHANDLKNTLLLDNELMSEQDENDEDLSLGDLDELSETQSEYSMNDESNISDNEKNLENVEDLSNDNIQLDFEELSNISKSNDSNKLENINILKGEESDYSDSDSSSSSGLDSEPEKITIHY